MDCSLLSYLRNLCLNQGHRDFHLCLLLKLLCSFRFYVYICDLFWDNFCYGEKYRLSLGFVWFLFLHMDSKISSSICLKDYPLVCLCPFVKNQLIICMSLFLYSRFCLINLRTFLPFHLNCEFMGIKLFIVYNIPLFSLYYLWAL